MPFGLSSSATSGAALEYEGGGAKLLGQFDGKALPAIPSVQPMIPSAGVQGTQTAAPLTPAAPTATGQTVQLGNGEFVSKDAYEKLPIKDQQLLNTVGIEKFNQQKEAEFEKTYVKLSTGDYVTREGYDKLPAEDQALLSSLGVEKYNLAKQTAFESVNVKLGTGEYVAKELYDKLSADDQSLLSKLGVTQFNTQKQSDLQANYVKLDTGEYVPKVSFDSLPAADQQSLKQLGVNAFNEAQAAKYVQLSTGEYVARADFDSMPAVYQTNLKQMGIDKFNEWVRWLKVQDMYRTMAQGATPPPVASATPVTGITGWKPDFTKANPYEGMPPEYAALVAQGFVPTTSNPLNPVQVAAVNGQLPQPIVNLPTITNLTPQQQALFGVSKLSDVTADMLTAVKDWKPDFSKANPYENAPPDYLIKQIKEFVPSKDNPLPPALAYLRDHPDAVLVTSQTINPRTMSEADYSVFQSATPDKRFQLLIDYGYIPAGSEYSGISDKGEIQFLTPDKALQKQLGELWNQRVGDLTNQSEEYQKQAALSKSEAQNLIVSTLQSKALESGLSGEIKPDSIIDSLTEGQAVALIKSGVNPQTLVNAGADYDVVSKAVDTINSRYQVQQDAIEQLRQAGALPPTEYGPLVPGALETYLQKNPTQNTVDILKNAGFSTTVTDAAEDYVRSANDAMSVLNRRTDLATMRAEGEKGFDGFALDRAILEAKIPLVGSSGVVTWRTLDDSQKRYVAGLYAADVYKQNLFASVVRSLETTSANNLGLELLGMVPVTIAKPIAETTVGIETTPLEWAASGLTVASLALLPVGGGLANLAKLGIGAGLEGIGAASYAKSFSDLDISRKVVYGGLLALPVVKEGIGMAKGVVARLRPDTLTANSVALTSDVGRVEVPKGMSNLTARQLVEDVLEQQLNGEISASRLNSIKDIPNVDRVLVTYGRDGSPDIVLKTADGDVVGHVSGLQRVLSDILMHGTPNGDALLQQIRDNGYLEVKNVGDKPFFFASPQAAENFAFRTSASNPAVESPAIFGIRLGHNELPMRELPKEVLDSPNLTEMRSAMERLAAEGKLESGIYPLYKGYGTPTNLEYEVVIAPGTKLYPVDANTFAPNINGAPQTYVTSALKYTGEGKQVNVGDRLPMYWLATEQGLAEGKGVPSVSQIYVSKILGDLTAIRQYAPWNLRLRPRATPNPELTTNNPLYSSYQQLKLKAVPEDTSAGRVSAVIYNNNGDILLTRTQGKQRFDLPGGGVTKRGLLPESIDKAMVREVREELGVTPSYVEHVDTLRSSFDVGGKPEKFQIFEVEANGKPRLGAEVAEYVWWDGKSELKYPVAEFTKDAMQRIRDRNAMVDAETVKSVMAVADERARIRVGKGEDYETALNDELAKITDEAERTLVPYQSDETWAKAFGTDVSKPITKDAIQYNAPPNTVGKDDLLVGVVPDTVVYGGAENAQVSSDSVTGTVQRDVVSVDARSAPSTQEVFEQDKVSEAKTGENVVTATLPVREASDTVPVRREVASENKVVPSSRVTPSMAGEKVTGGTSETMAQVGYTSVSPQPSDVIIPPAPDIMPIPIPPVRVSPPKKEWPPILFVEGDDGTPTKRLKAGIIEWRQGRKWAALPPKADGTYDPEDVQWLDRPLPGTYKFSTGKGSAYRTLQVIGGPPAHDADVDMGWAQVHISAKGKDLVMSFAGGEDAANDRWDMERQAQTEYERQSYANMPVQPVTERIPRAQGRSSHDVGLNKTFIPELSTDKLRIYTVNGEYIRDKYADSSIGDRNGVDFMGGGHSGVYWKIIPEDEIWIEEGLSPTDRKKFAIHEIKERETMLNDGVEYSEAHEDYANVIEAEARKNPEDVDAILQESLAPYSEQRPKRVAKPKRKVKQPSQDAELAERYYLGRRLRSTLSSAI